MMVYVVNCIENGVISRPKVFTDENSAISEIKNIYLEKLKEYTLLAKESKSLINYSSLTDSKIFISVGENKYSFELKMETCMTR